MFKTLFFLLLMIAPSVYGQQAENLLDPVTVSASLTQLNASKTGRNISSIKGSYFSSLPIHSIDELLKYIPGVEVQMRGPGGSQADIVIRGGTFQQVLVLLDGLRLNDPNTGHFNGNIPISPGEIERIEVLKGAASAIYGTDAVGGVVHIITKTFSAKENNTNNKYSVQAIAGNYGLKNLNAGLYYQKGHSAIAAGYLVNSADGQAQRGTTGFFNNQTASFSLRQQLSNNWRLAIRSAFDKRDFSAQNFYTSFKSDTAKEIVATNWHQLSLGYQKAVNQFQFDAGYKKLTDEFSFNSGSLPNNNLSSVVQINTHYSHQYGGQSNWVAGLQYQNKKIISNDRGDHQLQQAAGYFIVTQAVCNKMLFSPSLRLDYTENSGTELVPQLNISYQLTSAQIRGSIGKTIRQADFTERYNNYNKILVSSGSIGNPNLAAERSLSYELGFDVFVKTAFKLSATIFKRDQQKLIDWTPTPYSSMPRTSNLIATGSYALATNIAKVNTAGFETDIQYHQELNQHHKIWATLGLVWLDSESSNVVPSFYISSHAKLLTNLMLVYSNQYVQLSANGVYKIRTAQNASAINATITPNYFLLNTRCEVFIVKKVAGCFIEASNLFDTNYSDLLGAQMPGRWIMAGINLTF